MQRTTIVAMAVCAWVLAGCECESTTAAPEASGEGAESAQKAAPTAGRIGVSDDGEQIVFAPQHGADAVPALREDRLVRVPTEPDPEAGVFTLEEAVEGLPIDGQLVAEISTDLGTMFCDLYADRAPLAVANFIGLARGNRAWWDARAGAWRTVPYYRGTGFHRVIPEYMIQGGDYLADGSGTVGYTLPHEPHETLTHDRAGRLAMATSGDANTGGAQFYLTDGPAPQLDGTATIFGQCRPDAVISQIARVPQSGQPDNRPLTAVRIARVVIQRIEGGAAAARVTVPQLPAGEPAVGRQASPGPSEIRSLEGMRRRRQEAFEELDQQARDVVEEGSH